MQIGLGIGVTRSRHVGRVYELTDNIADVDFSFDDPKNPTLVYITGTDATYTDLSPVTFTAEMRAHYNAGEPFLLVQPAIVESPDETFTAPAPLVLSPADNPATVETAWLESGVDQDNATTSYTASSPYAAITRRITMTCVGEDPVAEDIEARGVVWATVTGGYDSTWSDDEFNYYVISTAGAGTLTGTAGVAEAEAIAGGGGTDPVRYTAGGGGGAGARVVQQIVLTGSDAFSVGAGGRAGLSNGSSAPITEAENGGNTTLAGVTAEGGGHAGWGSSTGAAGGCGAGGNAHKYAGGAGSVGGNGGRGNADSDNTTGYGTYGHKAGGGGGGMGGDGEGAPVELQSNQGNPWRLGGPGVTAWDGSTVCKGGDGGYEDPVNGFTGQGADGANPGDGGDGHAPGSGYIDGSRGADGRLTVRIAK